MNQQQNSYPQNIGETQYYIPPRKKHNFIAFGLIIIVLMGAIGLYFAIQPKLQSALSGNDLTNTATPQLQTATQTPKVEITALKLCDSVDEKFICNENKERVFKRGDVVYIYFEVIATSKEVSNKPTMQLTHQTKIMNIDGKVMLDRTEQISHVTETNDLYILPIKKKITFTTDDPLGKGTINIIISDKSINQKTTKTINFELK